MVAGSAKGRRLVAPDGVDTRPTSDRVRESIFNALYSMDAVDGATVVDLFAGSGALGIEALSRGASHCTFVEPSRSALDALRANLASTGVAAEATVVAVSAEAYLARHPDPADLALCDPPYAFEGWEGLLDALAAGLVVCESNRPIDPGQGWRVVRTRRYGGTVVTFARPRPGG